jgi:hypothetical protein
MKKILLLAAAAIFAPAVPAQDATTFTGTVLTYGSGFNTRARTRTFTLRIKRTTPDSEATRLVRVLEDGGQDKLLDEIKAARRDKGQRPRQFLARRQPRPQA